MAHTYTMQLTLDEAQALMWLAERYNYAEVLWGAVEAFDMFDPELPTRPFVVTLSEPAAWNFADAVQAEDGYLPSCGGDLRDKITALLESIV